MVLIYCCTTHYRYPLSARCRNRWAQPGSSRQSKIVSDVIDYHASTDSLIELAEQSNVDMVAFYHLVPVPLNVVLEDVFKRGVPDNFLLAEDLMSFELPIGSDEIVVNRP